MDYVLPSSTVSPLAGLCLAFISLASITIFALSSIPKEYKNRFLILMTFGCLGVGTALSLFTIGVSLHIADDKAKANYTELNTGRMVFDSSTISPL